MIRYIAVLMAVAILVALPRAASAQILVLSPSVQEVESHPGERYSGQIRLQNQGAEARAVRVYQRDYLFHADGTSQYPAPGSQLRSNAGWMVVAPTELVVPPGQDVAVAYEVSVPADVDATGTYWSMVMVEPLPGDPGGTTATEGVGLQTTVRFGIQIATHVGVSPSHEVGLDAPRVARDEQGARRLELDLVNVGRAGYRPRISIEIYDETGVLRSGTDVQRGLLYPGTSIVQHLSVEDLPGGVYQAVVVVDTGTPELFGGQFTLTLGATGR